MSIAFHHSRIRLLAGVCAAALSCPVAAQADGATQLHEMTVTGTREGELKSETPASVTTIGAETIQQIQPGHPSEIMNRIPGAIVTRTSGEGHTTGIRHPIGTGSVYLYLEDGVPTRASGFFNHNALYEVNLPQAGGMEVIRGPGTALQGSDAIGAVINVLTRAPSDKPEAEVTAEAGSFGWKRALSTASGSWGDLGVRADLNATHTDGWRDATEYDRQSASLRADKALSGDSTLKAVFTATNVDQQSGGSSYLSRHDYYENPRFNYNANAYRTVQAMRGSVAWDREDGNSLTSLTPYVRWNRMELLPPWATSSVYETGHASLGLLAKYRHDFEPWRTRVVTGVDMDYSPGYRDEYSVAAVRSNGFLTSAVRGAQIYDYDVAFRQVSPYLHTETSPVERLRITAGLRYDVLSFDYHNNMSVVQTGSLRRPEDDVRWFSHLSPSLGATWAFNPAVNGFANYKQSFRVPGEGDLFRQGKNVDSIHLKPVKVDSYEVGLRGPEASDVSWELAAYHMVKRNDILATRDANSDTQTNNGRTHHTGIEAGLGWRFQPEWKLGLSGTVAKHTYENWYTSVNNATVNYSGNTIASAPRYMGTMVLGWQPREALKGLSVEAEWQRLAPFEMDAANTLEYNGHDLFNLRAAYAVNERLEVFGRIMNLMNEKWAEQAQISGAGQEQYAPGMPRTIYAGIKARF